MVKISVVFPYQFYLATKIISLIMDIKEESLTYREVLEILADSFDYQVRNRIFTSDNEIMVIIIVDNKRIDPNDQVRDGVQITLMMPIEGGWFLI